LLPTPTPTTLPPVIAPVTAPLPTLPPTTLLCLDNTYHYEDTAKVLYLETVKGSIQLTLDRTLFYPQGGGQPSDVGSIELVNPATNQTIVFQVKQVTLTKSGIVLHAGQFVEGVFNVGDTVIMKVDKSKRMFHARLHTAGHLMDEACRGLSLPWKPTKGNNFPNNSYCEYDGTVSDPEQLITCKQQLQEMAGKLIESDKNNTDVKNVPYAEAIKICGEHSVPAFLKDRNVRLVSVRGSDGQYRPCCATHVNSLKEIGPVTITKIQHKHKNIKVFYSVAEN